MNTRSKFMLLSVIIVASLGLFLWILPGKFILPQSIILFGWPIRIYGVLMGLAVLAGYYLARKKSSEFGITNDQLDSLVLVLVITGFIGARVYHVFSSWEFYLEHPAQALMVWQGGLSVFGAVIGGAVGAYLYKLAIMRDVSYWAMLDWLAPSLVLGQVIGRFGNLFNYEAYGSPTSLPWKMFVPEEFRLSGFWSEDFYHPVFLYEALAGGLILLILLNFSKLSETLHIPRFRGQIFAAWLLLYGLVRIFTESLRLDSPYLGSIKQNLIVAMLMATVGLSVLVFHKFIKRNESITP